MKETHLKYRVSKMILFGEMLLLVTIFILYSLGGFTQDQLITILGFILPVNILFLTAILKFANENRVLPDGKNVPSFYAGTAFYLLLLLFLSLIVLILSKAIYNLVEFSTFKTILLIIQSVLGVYGGFIITELFASTGKKENN